MVPQRPYLAPNGLLSNVIYPLSSNDNTCENRVRECLKTVGIEHLVERHGLMEAPNVPWDEVLSGGEQQRLCLSRCLFHEPAFAMLDECTSMISQDVESTLYTRVVESGIVPITFSQRLLLPEHHKQELRLGEESDAGWRIQTPEEPV